MPISNKPQLPGFVTPRDFDSIFILLWASLSTFHFLSFSLHASYNTYLSLSTGRDYFPPPTSFDIYFLSLYNHRLFSSLPVPLSLILSIVRMWCDICGMFLVYPLRVKRPFPFSSLLLSFSLLTFPIPIYCSSLPVQTDSIHLSPPFASHWLFVSHTHFESRVLVFFSMHCAAFLLAWLSSSACVFHIFLFVAILVRARLKTCIW